MNQIQNKNKISQHKYIEKCKPNGVKANLNSDQKMTIKISGANIKNLATKLAGKSSQEIEQSLDAELTKEAPAPAENPKSFNEKCNDTQPRHVTMNRGHHHLTKKAHALPCTQKTLDAHKKL